MAHGPLTGRTLVRLAGRHSLQKFDPLKRLRLTAVPTPPRQGLSLALHTVGTDTSHALPTLVATRQRKGHGPAEVEYRATSPAAYAQPHMHTSVSTP